MTYRLRFANLGREIAASADDTLYQSARRGGVRIVGACGGRGACGTCVVRVVEGEVELTEEDGEPAERESLRDRQWVRACRVHARSDCTVEVAPRSLAPVVRADMASLRSGTLALDPAVRQRELVLAPATLDDPVADLDRVARALDCDTLSACDAAAARQLPGILRAHAWRLRARLHGGEAIGFAAPGSRALGLAVDLGTTNVAAFLIDLDSGIQLASLGIENPQAAWGADVISRLNFASRSSAGGDELRAAAVAGINALAADLCEAVGVHGEDIVDLALCGNTAMHHLLLGLPVHQLGHAPFVAVLRDSLDIKARELGIRACAGAYVHIAPGVGGFVGGDHVAALLGTEEIWSNARLSIVMDIGTNTEISLIHHGEILTASCPSGPALEGGHISCGMRAAEGAIERVRLSDGRIAVQTIGGGKAVGVCGSGVLDAVATLHAAGIVDARGRIVEEHA
ncbi:MAG: ASKHA domain-containing protein, partial [Betaproteobacteria bacterium]|nr:ASKHA domain-containing protein [Betaproteobacteria bacterium]